jgi:hypothetical protein
VKESTGLEKEVRDSSCFIDLAWNLGRRHWVLHAAIAEASLNQHLCRRAESHDSDR